MIQGSQFLANFSGVHTMTSNQITQLWETHSVPARHHILIVLLNMPRALLLTINTRGTSNPVFIHTSNFLYGKTNCLHYEQSWFYTTISGRFVSKPLRFWCKCGFDLFNAFAWLQAMPQSRENLLLSHCAHAWELWAVEEESASPIKHKRSS